MFFTRPRGVKSIHLTVLLMILFTIFFILWFYFSRSWAPTRLEKHTWSPCLHKVWLFYCSLFNFYTPVWKTGRIMPWQCSSVRPSVRPRFPDFSSTCFEISIWNLVYTFSRWHDMSSLSCITIGSFWPSLQPKVGQTHFLQSWPHKSR